MAVYGISVVDNIIYKTVDLMGWEAKGIYPTIQPTESGIQQAIPLTSIAYASGTTLYGLSSNTDTLWKSTDEGATWIALGRVPDMSPTLQIPQGGAALAINGGNIYLTSRARTELYRSTDEGQSWSIVGAIPHQDIHDRRYPVYIRSLSYHTKLYAIGSYDSNIWASTDEGQSWSVVGQKPKLQKGSLDFAIAGCGIAANADGLMLCSLNTQVVFRTTDEGQSWSIAGSVPQKTINNLSIATLMGDIDG